MTVASHVRATHRERVFLHSESHLSVTLYVNFAAENEDANSKTLTGVEFYHLRAKAAWPLVLSIL